MLKDQKWKGSISVFSGTRNGDDQAYIQLAGKLGQALAQKKLRLVFGAGTTGIMQAVAVSASANQGIVIGVLPNFMIKEYGMPLLDEIIIVQTMTVRKSVLYSLGDAYVALPGGLGTCEELIEVISAKNLRLHNRPIVLFGPNVYWSHFIDYIKYLSRCGFLNCSVLSLFLQTCDVDEAMHYIEKGLKKKSINNLKEGSVEDWVTIHQEDIVKGQNYFVFDKKFRSICVLSLALESQHRAAEQGFTWKTKEEAFNKIIEELAELRLTMINDYNTKEKSPMEEELGDVFLALINLSRHLNIDPRIVLLASVKKFKKRLALTKRLVEKNNCKLDKISLNELLHFWNQAKCNLAGKSLIKEGN